MISADICSMQVALKNCGQASWVNNMVILKALKDFLCESSNYDFVPTFIAGTEAATEDFSVYLLDGNVDTNLLLNPNVLGQNIVIVNCWRGNPLMNEVKITNSVGDIYEMGLTDTEFKFQAPGETAIFIRIGDDLYRLL